MVRVLWEDLLWPKLVLLTLAQPCDLLEDRPQNCLRLTPWKNQLLLLHAANIKRRSELSSQQASQVIRYKGTEYYYDYAIDIAGLT
jgi:hypothetical protein